jgi:hypothetical protein
MRLEYELGQRLLALLDGQPAQVLAVKLGQVALAPRR